MNLRRQKGRTPLSKFRARQPFGTGPSRQTEQAQKKRAESAVVKRIRAEVASRDETGCRLRRRLSSGHVHFPLTECRFAPSGPEWCHMDEMKRFQTRKMIPERRHATTHSFLGCNLHHTDYDHGRLKIEALTDSGADGRLRFTLGRVVYQEP